MLALAVGASASAKAPIIGLLRRGDEVNVLRCEPTCDGPRAWAWLEGEGAVQASRLVASPGGTSAPPSPFRYGRVREDGAVARAEPHATARVVERHRAGEDLAFLDEPSLAATGWLARPGGGFMRAVALRMETASTFVGEAEPQLPLAFVLSDTLGAKRDERARKRRASARHSCGNRWRHSSARASVVWRVASRTISTTR